MTQLQLESGRRASRRLSAERLARVRASREVERFRELMQYTPWLQRDHDRERLSCGLPTNFLAASMFGTGLSPLSLPNAGALQVWRASTLGLTMGTALIPTIPTDPAVNWDADVTQNLAPRCDILSTGIVGAGTYGLTLDNGLSYFQQGTIQTNTLVPLLGRTLIFSGGTYTISNQYNCVVKTVANQTGTVHTLTAAATDSAKPRVIANAKNGYAGLVGVGGTSGAMLDSSTTANLCTSGASFASFSVVATGSAVPAGIQCFWCFGNTGAIDADPCWYLGVRNASGAIRANRINDAGTQAFQEASTATTAVCLYTFLFDSNNVTVRRNGTTLISNLALGTGATTSDAYAIGCLYRAAAQSNAMAYTWCEEALYSTGSAADWTAGNVATVEGYFIGKYNLP